MACIAAGCFLHRSAKPNAPANTSASQTSDAPDNSPQAGPDAKIHISYGHSGDFLTSLVVTEYTGAEPVAAANRQDDSKGEVIRFEGGVIVWQIEVDKSLMSDMPLIGKDQPYAASEVKYGLMPPHFVSIVPDSGPPEPLDPDHYYVFTVTRSSGATSYEAVKVNGDGSLQGYEAEPRAGTSFKLCCNVAPDFVINAADNGTPGYGQP